MSSIQHRETPNGDQRWRVMWRSGGKQQGRTFTEEGDAKKWRILLDALGEARALEDLRSNDGVPTETRNVAEQVAAYIESRTGITVGTRRVYRSHLARVIEPTPLGATPLAMLNHDDVAAWVNGLDDSGAAAKTIRNYHGLLSGALEFAVREGRMPANPARKMRLPRTDHRNVEHTYLTGEQFAALHAAMTPHYQPLVLLLFGTGMRFGEATALRWRDVDFKGRSVRITRAWQYTAGAAKIIGSPKSKRSNRTIVMPTEVSAALLEIGKGKPDDFLLTAPKGGPIKQPVFYPHWKRAAETLNLTPRPRIHDARHSWASWAIQAGNPLPAIQRQLGHESIKTTVDTYGHLARADFDALAQATSVHLSLVKAPPIAQSTGPALGTPHV